MTATNHVVTGALIMTVVPNKLLGVALCLISHLILDVIPHFGVGDKELNMRAFVPILFSDMAFAATVLLAILLSGAPDALWIMAGAIVASSPDLLSIPYFIDGLKGRPHTFGLVQRFLGRIQWSETPKGIIVEALWVTGAGLLLIRQLA